MAEKLDKKAYQRALERMHLELLDLQATIRRDGRRLAVIFEGRDTAGKGGTIQRIVEPLNPRGYRVVALAAPTDFEKGQWYFQRYVQHLPGPGEICLFDRSWYNRAGVERVMDFATREQVEDFLVSVPEFERMLVRSGLELVKYFLDVDPDVQEERFRERLDDPMKRWKLSPIDLQARSRYEDYSAARDEMLERTSTPESPWFLVDANDQRRARLNLIRHLLDHVRHEHVKPEKLTFAKLEKAQRPSEPPASIARVPERW
ncbi:MAG: polyphosphate kinase 2 [Thermoleophilia bacterium]